ncbi:TonB-dependent siderophore receptor [Bdellovibrio bacteriovorus]|uniref:TonB-dependent siderophore receptor n=1 Tax=Bdellovibrio bacteriovorus TaxID=959 RepID=UPI003A810CE3
MKKYLSILNAMTVLLTSPAVYAQNLPTEINTITVQDDQVQEPLEAFGFPEIPAQNLPLSTSQISDRTLRENRIHRLSEITLIEASVTDSYNASGYWDYLSIRGFTLDNRANFLREGLPINAQTSIPLENKERLEVLKGLNGLQTGASSPGGMVNYVIKRPTPRQQFLLETEVGSYGNWLIAADAGGPVRGHDQFGYRLNVAHEQLSPAVEDSKGERNVLALANSWRLSETQLLESDIEWSKKSQPTQAAFSLLGSDLPQVTDPRLNLNNQSWSQPVVFTGLTGSLKYTHRFSQNLIWQTTAGAQELHTDDRLAYPFGCSAENNYDRYCSDGTFDMYDFRSENERRSTQAIKTSLQMKGVTGPVSHDINVGYLGHVSRERYAKQAYNPVGVGNVQGTAKLPADPALTDENTNRDSEVNELFAFDSAHWGSWGAWLGLRFSDVHRSSVRTDASRATDYRENFLLPWMALSYQFPAWMTYVSYGEGVETYVTPNRSGYTNPGQFVPDVISRQIEVGARGGETVTWNLAAFQIERPQVEDQRPDYKIDGSSRHQGVEAELGGEVGRLQWTASAMWLKARRLDSTLNPAINDRRPTNLPEHTLRAHVNYLIPGVQGLSVNSRVSYEGERAVTADNSLMLSAWTRWDAGASYEFGKKEEKTVVRLAVENLTDEKYWKESPTQYGHIYLYPGEVRSVFLTLQTEL